MNIIEILIIALLFICCISFAFCFYKYIFYNPADIEKDFDKLKLKLFEDLIFNISTITGAKEFADFILQKFSLLVNLDAISYLVVDGKKQIYKHSFINQVSKKYYKKQKDALKEIYINNFGSLGDSSYEEESLAGKALNPLSNSDTFTSSWEFNFSINSSFNGVVLITFINEFVDKEKYDHLKILVQILTNFINQIFVLLTQEKDTLSSTLEGLNEGVLLLDDSYKVLLINPAFTQLLKFGTKEKVNIFEVFNKLKSITSLNKKVQEVFDTSKPFIIQNVLVKDTGKVLKLILLPTDLDKNKKGIIFLLRDVTQEVELAKIKEDFNAMIVHELRSPLTVIKGSSDLILRHLNDLPAKDLMQFLEQIKTSSSNMLDLVNDLLDLSKLESGKFQVFKSLSDINYLVNDLYKTYTVSFKQKNVQLILELDDVPPFMFDYEKIKQVLVNLISNALKFTTSGYVKIKTEFNIDTVTLKVIDSGSGISANDKKKLFSMYTQSSSASKSTAKGTGLGLFISKGIINSHNGEIWVEDNAPSGSVFAIKLPLK